jgi:hypothetical protein
MRHRIQHGAHVALAARQTPRCPGNLHLLAVVKVVALVVGPDAHRLVGPGRRRRRQDRLVNLERPVFGGDPIAHVLIAQQQLHLQRRLFVARRAGLDGDRHLRLTVGRHQIHAARPHGCCARLLEGAAVGVELNAARRPEADVVER